MDLSFPPEAEAFRAHAREFLAANLPAGWHGLGTLDREDAEAFCEVFFTDARIPADNVVGPGNGGWKVANKLLGHERGEEAATNPIFFRAELDRIIDLARQSGRIDDPVVRDRLAWCHMKVETMRFLGYRILTQYLRDGHLGATASISKLYWSEYHQEAVDLAISLLGADAMLRSGRRPYKHFRTDEPGRQHIELVDRRVPAQRSQWHGVCRHVADPAQHPGRVDPRAAQGTAARSLAADRDEWQTPVQRGRHCTLSLGMDRTSTRITNPNGIDRGSDFSVHAVSRKPADALGPRAQRTIARIIAATREVFLTRGYAGTTIDEIARAANVSRASFYTYFPTKRDVLLTVGARSASDALEVIERLLILGTTRAGLAEWAREYFAYLDINGSFAFAWTQAAHEDEAIRIAGRKRHLELCRQLGEILAESAGNKRPGTVELGLVMFSAFERAWSYCHLYADAVDRAAIEVELAQMLWAAARLQPATAAATG